MATIITRTHNRYTVNFSVPETTWISVIAEALGMSKESVVAAALNKGLVHYMELFCKPDEPERETPNGSIVDSSENGGQ